MGIMQQMDRVTYSHLSRAAEKLRSGEGDWMASPVLWV